jgi:iron complex transport system ATP-binding protein
VVGRGLDVGLAGGEVLALLGPNGGGKTTLLKTLLGLIRPLGGEVFMVGRPLSRLSVRERARLIAYVPQVHAGAFAFTVEDVVLMGRSAHADLLSRPSTRDRQVAAAMIERLGIAHLSDRPYTMISGGERQLALIARALAQEPRIVVLDEPTASLDFGNQGKVMREIRALAEAGLGVIFSTHDPNHAVRFADRAMLIQDGRCLADGASRAVLTGEALDRLYRSRIETIESNTVRVFLPD